MPLRAVEAEELRRWFVEADAAIGAGEVGGEDDVAGLGAGGAALGGFCGSGSAVFFCDFEFERRRGRLGLLGVFVRVVAVVNADDDVAFADAEGGVDRFGQSAADARGRFEAVDDDLDVVPHLAVEREIVVERHVFAVDAGPHEALLAQVFEQVFVFALLAADDGGEHGELRARFDRHDAGDDLLARLGGDRLAAFGAVAVADAGVEHAEEIVDFGDRADGRARVVAGRFLRDRDRRAEAADVVDLGLGHLPQELAGERGQTFHVAPLPFGIERVERERAFAGAGNAGQANQLVARAASRRRCAGCARGHHG